MELRRVTIHGNTLAYRTAGSGPVLLLVHGMAASSATWQRVMPMLSRHCTVVAPDLLGHGASAKPRSDYALAAHANLLRDLLAVLQQERATIVGHSFGGGVAMQLAYQFPEHCERLVLVGSGGLGDDVSSLLRALSLPGAEQLFPLACSPALRDTGRWLAGRLAGLGLRAAPVVEETWRSYASLAEPDARHAFFQTLRAVIDHAGQAVSARDRLYLAAHLPTLIVWGADDHIIPVRHAHEAHAAIPASRLQIHENVGHYPHVEEPDRFARTLIEFLDTTEAALLTKRDRHALLRAQADRGHAAVI